ncbi:MAG: peptide deformylase [Proteobacteria bacterium]|nr:peptide deformylase [Pseudomonadota bacterium]
MLLDIVLHPDERLRTRCTPVTEMTDRLDTLFTHMFETMYDAEGVGLASTQVGESLRFCVVDVSEDRSQPLVLINPEIVAAKNSISWKEGCLSIPEVYAEVVRPKNILVRALDRDFKPIEFEADELLSVCIQHEIDHLDGKLFIDYLSALKRRRLMDKYQKQQREEQA